MRSTRLLALSTLVGLAACSQAFDLDLTWAGGYTPLVNYSDGDWISLTDPVHIDSSSQQADDLEALLTGVASTAAIHRGSDVTGTFTADMHIPDRILAQDGTGYFHGSSFEGRLQSSDDLSNTYWVVMLNDEFDNSGSPYSYIHYRVFTTDVEPRFYQDDNEPWHRDGSSSYGDYDYLFEANLYLKTGPLPYDYSRTWNVFLVDDIVTGGQRSLTIRDGLSYGSTWHAEAVPEPATMAVLGLGALLAARRRTRR